MASSLVSHPASQGRTDQPCLLRRVVLFLTNTVLLAQVLIFDGPPLWNEVESVPDFGIIVEFRIQSDEA